MSNTAIHVQNITKIYRLYDSPIDRLKESLHPFRKKYHRDFYALNNVSFDVAKGETLGIIGQNGSGKSTILKILTGVLTASAGQILINGRVSALLELGAGFNPELTGIENVYFNGTIMGYSRKDMDGKIDDILAFADIGDFVHQPTKTYSSGMFVRLAFASALSADPDVLIVDEALAVGDIRFQRKCFSKIEELRSAGRTILFVSHAIDTVNLLCDHAILMNNGRLLEIGLPKAVTKIYQRLMLGEDVHERSVSSTPPDDGKTHHARSGVDQSEGHGGASVYDSGMERVIRLASERLKDSTVSKKAEIIDYAILDKTGKRVTLLETGEQYTLLSRILIYTDVKQIHLGYPIKDKRGVLLFATNSAAQKVRIMPQKRGNILEGRVDITMWLAPGDYFLSFRVFKSDEDYDELTDIIHFVVAGNCNQVPGVSLVNLSSRLHVENIR